MAFQSLVQLALIGLFVAAVPLTYATIKGKTKNFPRLIWLLAFCTFDLIVFGAFTRLTDSGLGCPDWPGCYGHSNPLAAMDKILSAQEQMPFGPVSVSKAWIEMLHRYFAMGVGVLVMVSILVAWVKRKEFGLTPLKWSLALLLLICLQGAFGAWTVTLKLQPIIVTTHLMLGLCLLMGLVALSEIATQSINKPHWQSPLRKAVPLIGLLLLLVQVFLGGWVSTNYAVLACSGFPMCNGAWVPDMDFLNGFTWWRELGKTASGEYLDVQALTAIHWVHRLGALIVFIVLVMIWRHIGHLIKTANQLWIERVKPWWMALGVLIILQLLTGMSNVVLDWPIIAALMHTAGAAALLAVMTKLILLSSNKL